MRWHSLWSSFRLLIQQATHHFSSFGFCLLIISLYGSYYLQHQLLFNMLLIFAFFDNVDHHCWGMCFTFQLSLTMLIIIPRVWCLLCHRWHLGNFNVLVFPFPKCFLWVFFVFLFCFSFIFLWFHLCRCFVFFFMLQFLLMQVLVFLQIPTAIFHFLFPSFHVIVSSSLL